MPKSRVRKKQVYTPPPTASAEKKAVRIGSPVWLVPTMIACFVIGLVWIVLYYIAGSNIPFIKDLGVWNIVIGFAFFTGGFGLAMRWR